MSTRTLQITNNAELFELAVFVVSIIEFSIFATPSISNVLTGDFIVDSLSIFNSPAVVTIDVSVVVATTFDKLATVFVSTTFNNLQPVIVTFSIDIFPELTFTAYS